MKRKKYRAPFPGFSITFLATLLLTCVLLCQPAPTQAASFDCGKAATSVEKMICTDSELSKLDEELAKKYQQAKQKLQNASWFTEQQRLWLKYRNGCTDKTCLVQLHKNRLGDIVWYLDINKKPTEFYTYTLDINNNPAVCEHMEKVYNAYFRQPWERGSKKLNTPGGINSFPPYPGVEDYDYTSKEGLDRSTYKFLYNRRPSSPEYDAVPWRVALMHNSTIHAPDLKECKQGWKKGGAPSKQAKKDFKYSWMKNQWKFPSREECFRPYILADVDIDNDGTKEMVIKTYEETTSPRVVYYHGHNDVCGFDIFLSGSMDVWEFDTLEDARTGKFRKAGLGYQGPSFSSYLFPRLFLLHGTTYLSLYKREYHTSDPEKLPDHEYIEISRYVGSNPISKRISESGYYPNGYKDILVDEPKLDTVCRFTMHYHSQQP